MPLWQTFADDVSNMLRLCDKGLDTAELLTHVSDFATMVENVVVKGGAYHTMGFAEFTLRKTLSKTM